MEKNFRESLFWFKKAQELAPFSPVLISKMYHAYIVNELIEEALQYLESALLISQDDPEILFCLGQLQNWQYKNKKLAKEYYRKASSKLVENFKTKKSWSFDCTFSEIDSLSNYYSFCLEDCDWEPLSVLENVLRALVQKQINTQVPINLNVHSFQCLFESPMEQKKVFEYVNTMKIKYPQKIVTQYSLNATKKIIKIGYLSPDFNDHIIGKLIVPIMECHDRNKFSVYAISLSNKNDFITEKIKKTANHYLDLYSLTDKEVALKIAENEIDILVDLGGYTTGGQIEVLNFQPSPIQAHYLGMTGTTGSHFIDYYISAPYFTNDSHQPFFTEKIAYLPDCIFSLFPFGNTTSTKTRKDYHLPEKEMVYACFSQAYRINKVIFGAWMQILMKVPGSVLWLNAWNSEMITYLKAEAVSFEIDPQRIIFKDIKKLDIDWEIGLADVYLDTYPISGSTPSLFALSAGVPVVTQIGESPHSGCSASLLSAFQLTEWVGNSIEQYIQKAVHLGLDERVRLALKKQILQHQDKTTLFKPKKFISHLEALYLKWIEKYLNAQKT